MRALDAPHAREQVPARRWSRSRVLPTVLLVQDAVLVYAALAFAYWTRYGLRIGPQVHDSTAFSGYQQVGLLLLALTLGTLHIKGAYRERLSTDVIDEAVIIFSSATIAVAAVVVVMSMLHQYEYSRGVIVYMWLSLIVFLVLGRTVNRSIRGWSHRHGWGSRRLLVVGASDAGKIIMQSVVSRPDLGYEVVGFVDHRPLSPMADFGRFRAIGQISDIPEIVETYRVDDIIVALPASAHNDVWSIVKLCEQSGVALKLVPDLLETSLSRVQVDDIAGIPLFDVREMPLRRAAWLGKRALDIVLGSLICLLSLPLVAILGLLVKLESEGPAFIIQERVGQNGRTFRCHKLRTMRVDADQILETLLDQNQHAGPIFKMRDDPRCTRVGRHIRRFSLDELPQIWNVVRGDMSLVGPRPPLPREVQFYDSWQMRRLETKPGMTGIWQVSGRSDLSFDEMVMMDVMYVDNWSLSLDLKVLLRTVVAVVAARGAY
ncbi:MAG TPA: sugar transferase [Chloroflexota bacterium]|nr:sugar transferase [Chloroflexota bacterium]